MIIFVFHLEKKSLEIDVMHLMKTSKKRPSRTLKKGLRQLKGLCFSYLFGSIIITSVLRQWPKSLISKHMVSGFLLFQNPSFVVVTFSIPLKVFTPRGKGKHLLCRLQCQTFGKQCYGP